MSFHSAALRQHDVDSTLRPAVFLDKDGTLLQDVAYNVDPAKMRFMPNAERGLALLESLGYALIVVSNQAGVALGRFAESALADVHEKLRGMFRQTGARLCGFYYCPHAEVSDDGEPVCACRKPRPGLITSAARAHRIDLSRSWMIGDILNDVQAGYRAGCRTILLNNGHETRWRIDAERRPDFMADDLYEAARVIQSQTIELNDSTDSVARNDRYASFVFNTPRPSMLLRHPHEAQPYGVMP